MVIEIVDQDSAGHVSVERKWTEISKGTLAAAERFRLFSATNYSGAFTHRLPPMAGPGLAWDTTSLITDGTLRVAVAPRGAEAFAGLWPGDFGGNMDAPDVREGTTVYLPIFHDGAYFYFGDGHARQGDGEVAGTGLETSMDVVLQLDVVKNKKIDWPRLEDAEYIMVAGSGRPLIDAFRLAHVELVEWLVADYGFGKWDAYQLLGELAESRVANIVDPAYTVIAKYPKKYLPR